MCVFTASMTWVKIYNVNSHENKWKPLNFWQILYVFFVSTCLLHCCIQYFHYSVLHPVLASCKESNNHVQHFSSRLGQQSNDVFIDPSCSWIFKILVHGCNLHDFQALSFQHCPSSQTSITFPSLLVGVVLHSVATVWGTKSDPTNFIMLGTDS